MSKKGWNGESKRHSLAKKGIKTNNLFIISNPNTINLNKLKQEDPLSYYYYKLREYLMDYYGISLIFVKQDKNYIYFKLKNRNGKESRIMDVTPENIIDGDSFFLNEILEESIKLTR